MFADILGDHIVICTAFGMVVVDHEGRQVSSQAPHSSPDHLGPQCVYCLPLLRGIRSRRRRSARRSSARRAKRPCSSPPRLSRVISSARSRFARAGPRSPDRSASQRPRARRQGVTKPASLRRRPTIRRIMKRSPAGRQPAVSDFTRVGGRRLGHVWREFVAGGVMGALHARRVAVVACRRRQRSHLGRRVFRAHYGRPRLSHSSSARRRWRARRRWLSPVRIASCRLSPPTCAQG